MLYLARQKMVTGLLLMMVFLAQSLLPQAMACTMQSHAMAGGSMVMSTMMMDATTMDHSGHGMMTQKFTSESQSHSTMSMDCCDQDCKCPAGSCSVVVLISHSLPKPVKALALKISQLPNTAVFQTPNLPFRPPISA